MNLRNCSYQGNPVSGTGSIGNFARRSRYTKPLAEVRAKAIALWTHEQQITQLRAKAATLVANANKAHSFDGIAKSLGVAVQTSPALTRGTDSATFSKALVASLFNAPAGGTISGPASGGGYVIARVTGITHPLPPERDPGYLRGVRQLSGEVASDFTTSLSKAEETREGVTLNQKLVDGTIGNSGSGS